ncbi:hypothetical protein NL529_31695, partial [Klebsiella pneumoniae]|nr:hypothetical protein [Klebsiella pneumoniae]
LGGATFSAVAIAPEGLTLQGSAPFISVPDHMDQEFWLTGSVITSSKTPLSTGTYHASFPLCDIEKDYPYTEYAQQQSAVYSVHA